MKTSGILCIALMMVLSVPLQGQNVPLEPTSLPIGSAIVSEVKGEMVITSPQGNPVAAQRGITLTRERVTLWSFLLGRFWPKCRSGWAVHRLFEWARHRP